MSAAPISAGMAHLSQGFYTTAHGLTVDMANGALPQYVTYPAAVVILLVACLEAYRNEFLSLLRQLEREKWEAKFAEFENEYRDTRRRWLRTPLLFDKQPFDPGKEPFQSFCLLISLRNELVHYNPRFRTVLEFPSKRIQNLRTKFEFTHEGNADWTAQVLNLNCAKWGCRTVLNMVHRLHELVGGFDFSTGPRPWPEPPR